MSDTLHLEIHTPEGRILSEDVREVVVPTTGGDLGILPQHSPLTAVAKLGDLKIRHQTADTDFSHVVITGGLLEIKANQVRVLVDEAVQVPSGEDAAVQRELEAAQQRIQASQEEVNAAKSKLDLESAAIRAQAAGLRR